MAKRFIETETDVPQIFYIWGHSYEMMEDPVLWQAYEDKLKRLNEDPEVEWINVIDLVSL